MTDNKYKLCIHQVKVKPVSLIWIYSTNDRRSKERENKTCARTAPNKYEISLNYKNWLKQIIQRDCATIHHKSIRSIEKRSHMNTCAMRIITSKQISKNWFCSLLQKLHNSFKYTIYKYKYRTFSAQRRNGKCTVILFFSVCNAATVMLSWWLLTLLIRHS